MKQAPALLRAGDDGRKSLTLFCWHRLVDKLSEIPFYLYLISESKPIKIFHRWDTSNVDWEMWLGGEPDEVEEILLFN